MAKHRHTGDYNFNTWTWQGDWIQSTAQTLKLLYAWMLSSWNFALWLRTKQKEMLFLSVGDFWERSIRLSLTFLEIQSRGRMERWLPQLSMIIIANIYWAAYSHEALFKVYCMNHLISSYSNFIIVVQSPSGVQLCSLMDCSMPGFPVLHCLPEFA